jgi:hypothetical protein
LTDPRLDPPTAKQLASLVQDTELSQATAPGLGLGSTDHELPFQASTRVCRTPPGYVDPTATQVVTPKSGGPTRSEAGSVAVAPGNDRGGEIVQETELSWSSEPVSGTGVTDQELPFHDSARGDATADWE